MVLAPKLTEPLRVLANPARTINHVQVLKNASSRMRLTLIDIYDWADTDTPKGNCYAFIRNPVTRWVSGMTEDYHRGAEDFLKHHGDETEAVSAFNQVMAGDLASYVKSAGGGEHTLPQHWYFENIPSLTLICLEDFSSIWPLLGVEDVSLPSNVIPESGSRRDMYATLTAWAAVPENKTAIETAYADDMALWNATKPTKPDPDNITWPVKPE